LGTIEDVVKERGSQLLVKVFQGVVRNSSARKVEGDVRCGKCADKAVYLGQRPKRVHLRFGEVEIERGCYRCKRCSSTWAPLDEQMGIDQSGRSPRLVEAVTLLGSELPFVPAAERLAQLCGVELGPSQVEVVSEGIGRSMEAQQIKEMEAAFEKGEMPQVEEKNSVVVVSIDGVMVSHRDGYHETKVAAIDGAAPDPKKEDRLRVERWSYVTHTGDVGTFGKLAWMESYRRGEEEAQEVIVLGDGAAWIWGLAEEHWPRAVHILDFWHASEHLWSLGRALFGEDDARVGPWVEAAKARLAQGQVKEMIKEWRSVVDPKSPKSFSQELSYFCNQSDRMNYHRYRERGYPIGSGSVESANRHVVGVRVKQSGMRWLDKGLRGILALRALMRSGRWTQSWEHQALPVPLAP
jgi:hypothetical protein